MLHALTGWLAGGLTLLGMQSSTSTATVPSSIDSALDGVAAVLVIEEERAARELPPPPVGRAEPLQQLTEAGMAYLPRGFHPVDGVYDVIIHFHGAPGAIESAIEANHINAAVLIVNLGIGSGPYEDRYRDEKSLERVLPVIERTVAKSGVEGAHVGRIALSAWSAGYGAIVHALSWKSVAERVDAVLLADGMHAAFSIPRFHLVDDLRMAPFLRYAERAKDGNKLMAVSHSAIETYTYASTSETSAYLLSHLGLASREGTITTSRPMVLTSRADSGGFHVLGFAGNNTDAHANHLLALGDTLFPMLKTRWGG